MFRVPLLGGWLKSVDSILLGYAHGSFVSGRYEECLDFCLRGLVKKRKKNDSHTRWLLMEYIKHSVNSALKLNREVDYIKLRDLILDFPREKLLVGRELSELILKLSMWGYNFNDRDGILKLAKLAGGFDATWGEPDFLIGWFSLPDAESVCFFRKAIEKDASYKSRILNDGDCRKYPELLSEL